MTRAKKQRLWVVADRMPAGNKRSKTCGSLVTRLRLGRYLADIITDPKDPVFHWIVQEAGSPEIRWLGQETSFAAALEQGQKRLEELSKVQSPRRQAIYTFSDYR